MPVSCWLLCGEQTREKRKGGREPSGGDMGQPGERRQWLGLGDVQEETERSGPTDADLKEKPTGHRILEGRAKAQGDSWSV